MQCAGAHVAEQNVNYEVSDEVDEVRDNAQDKALFLLFAGGMVPSGCRAAGEHA
jgi:hypothetical protein